jgi:diguanylate cyclase (GGDEF)-like protein/putative nucleotidyltransferase with HDIG domain
MLLVGEPSTLRPSAKLFIVGMLAAGVTSVVFSSHPGGHIEALRFISFLLVSIISSGLKVKLPGITGTLSVNSIVIFYSISELSSVETVWIAIASAVFQSLWHTQVRPQPLQVLFNTSNVALSARLAGMVFMLWPSDAPLMLKIATAASTYFLVNTFGVSLIVGLTERKNAGTIWRTSYFWSFPYYLLGAAIAVAMSVGSRHFGWEVGLSVVPVVFLIYHSFTLYLGQLESQTQHANDLAGLHLRTIEALALAIEAKDQTTGEHLQRVQVYARELAIELKLPEQQRLAVQAAAILHDIGKLAVPDYIISKPGKLTPEEFDKMKIHPTVGAEILERINFPYPVAPIVRAHHEKWDGSGYPAGLKGEEIPVGARIITAVDCLDALASDRQYRKALPLKDAMAVLSRDSGKHFDPRIVEILERRYQELEKMARMEPSALGHLSVEEKVKRGNAPDAGFEVNRQHQGTPEGRSDFLVSIAAARQEAQSLYEFTQDLGNSLSLRETLSLVAARLKMLMTYDALCIFLKEDDFLVPGFMVGEDHKLFESLKIPLGAGLSGWVAEHNKPIINGNPAVEPGYLKDPNCFSILRSAIAVPLRTEQGTLGVMALYKKERDGFNGDHLRMLLAINSKTSVAIENSISYQSAKTRAMIDGLTALPNANALFRHLETELERCAKEGESCGVLVCDLDGFKQVNDQHGHLTGNRILQDIGAAFYATCRLQDYVARMGGDEFVLVLPGVTREALEARTEELQIRTRAVGVEVCGSDILDASVGAALYPDDGEEPEALLNEADRRMYREKRTRRSRAEVEAANTSGLLNMQSAVQRASQPGTKATSR